MENNPTLPELSGSATSELTSLENAPAPSVEVPRLMPVCPYCDTELKPFDYKGYYDSFVGWECRCDKLPNAEVQTGLYA